MGRAERRRAERNERLNRNKDTVTMTRHELGEIKRDILDDISNYNVEALMTCFALAEHRLYGFGPKRIFRSLQYIDELMEGVLDGTATIEGYKRVLEEEAGVVIKC